MIKTIIIFSGIIIAFLLLFQMSQYSISIGHWLWEFILVSIALVFLGLGWFLRSKKETLNSQENFQSNIHKIQQLGIRKREMEILQKVSEGLSNKEIGEALFVSENTIKTHLSNLFIKLDVKRRTQAVKKAKELRLIP